MSSSTSPIMGSGIDIHSYELLEKLKTLIPEFDDDAIDTAHEKVFELESDKVTSQLAPNAEFADFCIWNFPSNIDTIYIYFPNVPRVIINEDELLSYQRITKTQAIETIAEIVYGWIKLAVPDAKYSQELVEIINEYFIDDIYDADFD